MKEERMTLNICGLELNLITGESREYMLNLAEETERMIESTGSTALSRAAVTAALSFLDEKKKLESEVKRLKSEIESLKNETGKEKLPERRDIPFVKNPVKELYKYEGEGLTLGTFYEKEENSDGE